MKSGEQKIAQYLSEAHRMEQAMISVLSSQIAMTPRGGYRSALESHLRETRAHSKRVQRRLSELGRSEGPLEFGIGLVQSALGQALALGKAPLDLLRGTGGEEKVLKNAKDACASEALEIATYTAIERLARSVGDEQTAGLAESIRADEQKMLERVLRELPGLAGAVVGAEVRGEPSYEMSKTGAADAARSAGRSAKRAARRTGASAKRTSRQARKVPGVARAEGQIKGAVASEGDLPIANYGKLTAEEIAERLGDLSQVDLAKIDSYERRHENRSTVLGRISGLRGAEPWPGYDELSVEEVTSALPKAGQQRVRAVRAYERAHKDRTGVLGATERELTNT